MRYGGLKWGTHGQSHLILGGWMYTQQAMKAGWDLGRRLEYEHVVLSGLAKQEQNLTVS